jgi:hypothetical protein
MDKGNAANDGTGEGAGEGEGEGEEGAGEGANMFFHMVHAAMKKNPMTIQVYENTSLWNPLCNKNVRKMYRTLEDDRKDGLDFDMLHKKLNHVDDERDDDSPGEGSILQIIQAERVYRMLGKTPHRNLADMKTDQGGAEYLELVQQYRGFAKPFIKVMPVFLMPLFDDLFRVLPRKEVTALERMARTLAKTLHGQFVKGVRRARHVRDSDRQFSEDSIELISSGQWSLVNYETYASNSAVKAFFKAYWATPGLEQIHLDYCAFAQSYAMFFKETADRTLTGMVHHMKEHIKDSMQHLEKQKNQILRQLYRANAHLMDVRAHQEHRHVVGHGHIRDMMEKLHIKDAGYYMDRIRNVNNEQAGRIGHGQIERNVRDAEREVQRLERSRDDIMRIVDMRIRQQTNEFKKVAGNVDGAFKLADKFLLGKENFNAQDAVLFVLHMLSVAGEKGDILYERTLLSSIASTMNDGAIAGRNERRQIKRKLQAALNKKKSKSRGRSGSRGRSRGVSKNSAGFAKMWGFH